MQGPVSRDQPLPLPCGGSACRTGREATVPRKRRPTELLAWGQCAPRGLVPAVLPPDLSSPLWAHHFCHCLWAKVRLPDPATEKVFPGGSSSKNLPAMSETWVKSLDQEDPLQKEMATPSSSLAREIHGQRNPQGCKQPDTTEQLTLTVFLPQVKSFLVPWGSLLQR